MKPRRLDNAAWGFTSSCFVCEESNDRGLRIPFFHHDDRVVAEFSLADAFSGAPRVVHGGVVLSVLDEAMAWAAIAIGGRFAMTRSTSATFARPVRPGRRYRVEGFVDAVDRHTVFTHAVVLDEGGRQCAGASAELAVLSEAAAGRAIGEVTGDDRRYLRGDDAEPSARP